MGSFNRRSEDYEVLDKIGRGKYAQVFSAIQLKTGQKVALKILKPGVVTSQSQEVPAGSLDALLTS